jgi:hypothetical protein
MKAWHLALVILSTVVLCLVPKLCLAAERVEWSEFKTEKDGILLKASFPKGDWAWNDLVVLLNIRNCSTMNVYCGYYLGDSLHGFDISLTNERNQNVAVSPLGEKEWPDYEPKTTKRIIIPCGSYRYDVLAPGGQSKYRVKLSDYFVLTKPGAYKLWVRWGGSRAKSRNQDLVLELKDICFKIAKGSWFSRELTFSLIEHPETHP